MEMGHRGAGDRAMGRIAMRPPPQIKPAARAAAPPWKETGSFPRCSASDRVYFCRRRPDSIGVAVTAMLTISLGGCHFIGELAASDYIVRVRQQAEQDAIAAQVATMDVGDTRPWKIEHTIPIGNEHGEVRVSRMIATALTLCKELVFSVESGDGQTMKQRWYSTQVCHSGRRWKWSLAEPAVERWGSLK
jgi:hypothetical protein